MNIFGKINLSESKILREIIIELTIPKSYKFAMGINVWHVAIKRMISV